MAQITAGTFLLTMIGRNFPTPIPANSAFGVTTVGGTCANGIDGTASLVVNTAVSPATATNLPFTLLPEWVTVTRELESGVRRLCWRPGAGAAGNNWQYTGIKIGVVWNCNSAVGGQECSSRLTNGGYAALSANAQAVRMARTTCCRGAPVAGSVSPLGAVGQCVNPNVQTCCSSTAVDPNVERCCDATNQLTATHAGFCPCWRPEIGASLQSNCPTGERCCFATKYAEFNGLATPRQQGQCYRTDSQRCCNTGQRYDPGTQQCCVINGIQSVNVPCPCSNSGHCLGGQTQDTAQLNRNAMCCVQTAPVPLEAQASGSSPARACDVYNNYPTGTGAYQTQTCRGVCFDSTYQICCNGAVCIKEYESCCNATCCNKFAGKCALSFWNGAPGNKFNPNHFTAQLPLGRTNFQNFQGFLPFEQCTIIEQISPIKGFWMFVLPAMLILSSLIMLSLALVFANKATSRSFHPIELAMQGLAILIVIFGIPCYFAPVYKYGVMMSVLGVFTILVAAARMKWLNVVCVFVYVIALVYLFDPFNGNAFFTLASARNPDGRVMMESSGILHATGQMFHDIPNTQTVRYCTNYYDYFMIDPRIRDFERWDNPQVPTFGYCSRSWVTALLIIEGFLLIFVLVNFVVSCLALILRFKEDRGYDPIELEVRGQGW